MKSILWIAVFLLGAVAGGVVVFFARPQTRPNAPSQYGVLVSVVNDTGGTLKNVEVHYTGGSIYTDEIPPGKTFSNRINPATRSDLEVAYTEQSGKEICQDLKANLPPDGSGSFRIHVQSGGKLRTEKLIEAGMK